MINKIKNFDIKKLYFLLALIFIILLFFLNYFNIFSIIIGMIIILIASNIDKLKIKRFSIFLFLVMFFLSLIVIFIFKTPVTSDFELIYNAAVKLLANENVLNTSQYFIKWAYQTGPVLYTYLLLKIFNSVVFLKIVNCIFFSINCVLVYKISKNFVTDNNARKISFLGGFLPFPLLFNTVLSNQIPSSTFFYLGIYILIKHNASLKSFIFCAILLFIGNFIRTEGIIFVCAIIGFYLICLISKKNNKKMNYGIILFVFIYFVLNFSSSYLIQKSNINNEGLSNNNPSWKFILGLNKNYCGSYNEDDLIFFDDVNLAKSEVKNRIKNLNLKDGIELLNCKSKTLWSGGTLAWSFEGLENTNYNLFGIKINIKEINIILTSLNSFLFSYVFLLMIIGLLNSYIEYNKKNNLNIFIFINILAINFIVYSLIEVQPRYIYLLEISIIILASLGYEKKLNLRK